MLCSGCCSQLSSLPSSSEDWSLLSRPVTVLVVTTIRISQWGVGVLGLVGPALAFRGRGAGFSGGIVVVIGLGLDGCFAALLGGGFSGSGFVVVIGGGGVGFGGGFGFGFLGGRGAGGAAHELQIMPLGRFEDVWNDCCCAKFVRLSEV